MLNITLLKAAHLAEEVRNAPVVVPWCMISTVLLNGVLGWAIVVAFSFCIVPTLDDALASPTGYDFMEVMPIKSESYGELDADDAQVFYAAMGRAGTAGMTAILIILVSCATMGFLATASRQTWAFARDRYAHTRNLERRGSLLIMDFTPVDFHSHFSSLTSTRH